MYACQPCARTLCGACVTMLSGGKTAMCTRCGGLALPLEKTPGLSGPVASRETHLAGATPLFERVLHSLGYLGKKSVLLTLAGLAIFVYLGRFTGGGFFIRQALFVQLMFIGIEAAVYFQIVSQVAYGNDEELESPDFTDIWDFAIAPAFRYLASYALVVAAVVWAGVEITDVMDNPRHSLSLGAPAALVLAWLVLWPLMTAIAAIGRSVVAMYNPLIWVDTLRKLGMDYVVGAMAFWTVLALEVFVIGPAAVILASRIPVPVLPGYAAGFVVLLPKALRAKILGEMCRPYT